MKITPDDPRLTALALDELPAEEAKNLRAEVNASPELTRELEATASLAAFLGGALGEDELTLGAERREHVLRSGQRPDADVLVLESKKKTRRHSLMVIAGAAAVIVCGFSLLMKTPASQLPTVADGAGDGLEGTSAGQGVGLDQQSEVFAAGGEKVVIEKLTSIPLSFNIPKPDLTASEKWLSEYRKVLPSELSQSASWINAVSPTRDPQVTIAELGLSAELGECPWNPERMLLMISVRSLRESSSPHSLRGNLELESDRVTSAKFLNEATVPDLMSETGMVPLPAGESQVLFYELTLKSGLGRIGVVHLDTLISDGEERSAYLPIPSPHLSPGDATSDFQMATLMAEFARWNQTESSLDQLGDLSKRAEQFFSQVQDEKTRGALDMILLANDLLK